MTAPTTGSADGKRDFFVSFNQADRAWAEWIARTLEEAGYSASVQAWDFRPGHNFVLEMDRAARTTERTILVLSPNFLASRFTQPEWAAAFARDPTAEKGLLIPVRVEACDPQGLLGQIVYIDLVGRDEADAVAELLRGLKLRSPQPQRRPEAPPPFPRAKPPFFPAGVPPYRRTPRAPADHQAVSQAQRRKCFVIMPFVIMDVYENAIKSACSLTGYDVIRADEIVMPGNIVTDIVEQIHSSDVIIADLTSRNPNVFYELGVSHALAKNVVLISQNIDDVPFDLRPYRVLLYNDKYSGIKLLEKSLSEILEKMQTLGSRSRNPVTDFFSSIDLDNQ